MKIFLIVTAIILIAAFIIWKSDMEKGKKISSLILILGIYAAFSITNEFVVSPAKAEKIPPRRIRDIFYDRSILRGKNKYKLPK